MHIVNTSDASNHERAQALRVLAERQREVDKNVGGDVLGQLEYCLTSRASTWRAKRDAHELEELAKGLMNVIVRARLDVASRHYSNRKQIV